MTEFVIAPPPTTALPVANNTSQFPVRRVFCVGRNYAAHAREIGKDPDREPPFFFCKPADAVVVADGVVPYPPLTSNLHHEVEMVVALKGGGRNVPVDQALDLVWGYGVGVDLTRRDIQDVAKSLSRPWDWAKGFDASAPCSALHPVDAVGHPSRADIWLQVNGVQKQVGKLDEMIWSVPEVISHISQAVALRPGDLIFSGTPAGVGALQPGDLVTGGVKGLAQFSFTVGDKPA